MFLLLPIIFVEQHGSDSGPGSAAIYKLLGAGFAVAAMLASSGHDRILVCIPLEQDGPGPARLFNEVTSDGYRLGVELNVNPFALSTPGGP